MKITDTIKTVTETLQYVRKFTGSRILIKLGGSVLNDKTLVKNLCVDLSLIRAAGIEVVIVHGGSKAINQALDAFNLPSEFFQGQRITTPEMIDTIEMVLCGHVNKVLVRNLNAVGMSATGLSGCDKQMLLCKPFHPKLQRVGEITQVNCELIETYLATQTNDNLGIIPVISPIGVDAQGLAYNINADWAASHIASALNINKLIYLTDQAGIYDCKGNIMSQLNMNELKDLVANNIVKDGMLTKVNTILSALEQGIKNIHIISAKVAHSLITELFTGEGIGTICTAKLESELIADETVVL